MKFMYQQSFQFINFAKEINCKKESQFLKHSVQFKVNHFLSLRFFPMSLLESNLVNTILVENAQQKKKNKIKTIQNTLESNFFFFNFDSNHY